MLPDHELAVVAASAGADVVRRQYGAEHRRHATSATDFATDADIEAEQAIRQWLREHRPDDGFVGEESGTSGAGADRRWLVDPLCGTLNYAVRTPLVAVNVALRERDGIRTAAVAEPFADEVLWTDGDRARVRRGGEDVPAVPSSVSGLVDVNVDGASVALVGLLADPALRSRFGPRVVSTTLALAWVAVGRRAAYVTLGDLRDDVHFSAGLALCRAAGCVLTGIEGQPLHDAPGGLVAAADAETHAALLDAVRRVVAST